MLLSPYRILNTRHKKPAIMFYSVQWMCLSCRVSINKEYVMKSVFSFSLRMDSDIFPSISGSGPLTAKPGGGPEVLFNEFWGLFAPSSIVIRFMQKIIRAFLKTPHNKLLLSILLLTYLLPTRSFLSHNHWVFRIWCNQYFHWLKEGFCSVGVQGLCDNMSL